MDAADRDLMVTVLPIDPKNLGSQKCHIGPKMMKDLSLNMGTWVCITWQGCEVLCQIWPRSDLCEEYVQCDTTVYRTINPEKSRVSPSMLSGTIHKSNMKKLKVTKLNCVSVSLVSQRSTDEAIHYALDDSCLSDYIHNILVNHALFQNSVVRLQDLDHCGAHRYTRITHIIIKHFDIAGQQNSGKKSSNVKKVGIVSMSTKVKIVGQMSNERFEGQSVQCSYGGLENPAKMLKEYISYPFVYQESFKRLGLECPKGVLLHGPTGVGKTLLVRAVCAECNAFIVQINGPEIIGPHPGESEENLRKIFQKANRLSEEGPTVLFIDELDALCPKRGHGSRGHENRIVAQLLTLMDGLETREKLIVIGATNRPNAIDVALRRPGRFDIEIIIGMPNMGQRRDILAVHVNSLNIAQDVSLDMLAEITHGYVGADFAALCREASFMAIEKLNPQFAKVGSAVVVTMSDFKSAMNRITPSVQRGSDVFVDFNPISWQNIGGLEEVKAQLKQAVEWPMKHPKSFIRLGIHHPKGVLLYGPPGCCKTTLVRAAATACNAAFLSINAAQLYSPFVGDSEKTIAQVFHQARLCAPAILFLDELDTIVGKRSMESGHGNSVHERVLSALLNEMDGIGTTLQERRDPEKRMMEGELHDNVGISHMEHYEITDNNVLVVGATNRPDLLDSALLRPGRMDRIIYVPPPDSQTRHQILRVHTRHSPLATDVNLQEISAKTELYSGADLENLCREAALVALQENGLDAAEVRHCHFVSALLDSSASFTRKQLNKYADLLKY